MKKKLFSVILTFCFALLFLPITAFAETPTNTPVTIDVGGSNVANENYEITDEAIKIRKRDVAYELTGTTDKPLYFWGSNNASDIDQAFYLTLNNVSTKGIYVQNSPVKMVITAPENTVNTLGRVIANDLTIQGSGTINTSNLSVTQQTSYMPSALKVTDTTINIQTPSTAGDSCEWNGECVLSGSATVKYIGGGKYAALKLGVKSGVQHSLTLTDNAKLYCLQDAIDTPSQYAVDGLDAFNNTSITLMGNSYLEAEGKNSTTNYRGAGIVTDSSFKVQDNATVRVTAYNAGLSIGGDLTVTGGTIIAKSQYSNGIYANSISISNANIDTEGYLPALFGDNSLSISGSTVKSVSSNDISIFTPRDLSIDNSTIQSTAPEETDGISARGNSRIAGSWIETSGKESFDDIENSVLFNGTNGTVIGNATVLGDKTIAEGMTLTIPENTSLTVPEGSTFTNNGTTTLVGTVTNNGNIVCTSHSGGTATCNTKAVCDLCKNEYGDFDSSNHSGSLEWITNESQHTQKYNCCNAIVIATENHNWENGTCKDCGYVCAHKGGTANCTHKAVCEVCGEEYGEVNPTVHETLKHVKAKAATKESEGNIEYWYCKDCNKYFADENATKEISKSSTVIAKLSDTKKPNDNNKANNNKLNNNKTEINNNTPKKQPTTPPTGDSNNLILWSILLLGCIAVISFTVKKKRK